jgi:two-component system OmpR family sensor kinase
VGGPNGSLGWAWQHPVIFQLYRNMPHTLPPIEPIRGSYERLQALLDKLPAMVGYWDQRQRNRFGNQAYVDWFGVTPDWMLGRHIREILGERIYALNLPFIEGALRGEVQHFEREITDPSGVVRHSQAHYIPDVVDGQVRGFFVLVVDITPRKALADSLARELAQARELALALEARARAEGESAELRALVSERDRMLQERERMLQEREELLWFLAHEVRQPLNNASAALQAAAAALAQPALQATPAAREPVVRAEHVLQHVIEALNNNLTAATMLVAGAPPALIDADLAALIDLVLHDVDASHRGRVHVELGGCVARTVQLQPGLARLALSNLLNNALHYSPEQHPVLLRVYDSDEPLSLSFEVTDLGGGIPAEVQAHLFERGRRGSNARSVSGAGLGLYLVHQIVRLHGGTVTVSSAADQGTTIRLTLPQGVAP